MFSTQGLKQVAMNISSQSTFSTLSDMRLASNFPFIQLVLPHIDLPFSLIRRASKSETSCFILIEYERIYISHEHKR